MLHSFTGLAEASTSAELARMFIDKAVARLHNAGYQVMAASSAGWAHETCPSTERASQSF